MYNVHVGTESDHTNILTSYSHVLMSPCHCKYFLGTTCTYLVYTNTIIMSTKDIQCTVYVLYEHTCTTYMYVHVHAALQYSVKRNALAESARN